MGEFELGEESSENPTCNLEWSDEEIRESIDGLLRSVAHSGDKYRVFADTTFADIKNANSGANGKGIREPRLRELGTRHSGCSDSEYESDTNYSECKSQPKRVRRESNGGSTIGSVEPNPRRTITEEEWVKKVKENTTRDRLIHDIVDVRDSARYDFVIQKIQSINKINGFLLIGLHDTPNFRHFHILHNCNFYNGCRCAALRNIPNKKRQVKYNKLICDVSVEYLWNLIEYLSQEGRSVCKIIFGEQEWDTFGDVGYM